MKRLALIAVSIFFTIANGFSQRLYLDIKGGMMNYGGDLQDKVFTFNQSNSSFGVGLTYKISGHLSVSAGYLGGKLAASDAKTNFENAKRNLSFYSKISEANLVFQASLNDVPDVNKFTPYLFGGIAFFHFDPYAYTVAGEKVFLQPLNTEGQGLAQYPGREPYKLNQFALPFGLGFSYAVTNNIILSAEVSFRKLFTDHLDDVSSLYYADTALLRSNYGDLSAKMSFRSDETSDPLTFSDKLKRGNPERKDTYYSALFKVSFSLGEIFKNSESGNSFSKSVRKQAGCPVKVL